MPKQVFRVCFIMCVLLSLTQISRSEQNEANQTISSDPSEFLLNSAPASIQETLPPENSSLPSNDTAADMEFEEQTLSPQYSKDATPEVLAEPDFFSEDYSSPPSAEALSTQPELQPAFDQNPQINASTPAQSTNFQLPKTETETETVTSLPEVELDKANVNNSQITAAVPAPSVELTVQEVEVLSAEPKLEPEADNGNESPTEVSAPAPSVVPEKEVNSTLAAPLDEEVNESPVSSSLPNNDATEDTEVIPSEIEVNDNNSTVSDTSMDFTLPEVNDEPTQEASPMLDFDNENVNMPSVAHNPPDSLFAYVAEVETYDIVYEEDKDSWSSWAGDNPLVVAGGVVGVCFVGLASLVYSNRKKKKTHFQYQSLSKGI